MIQAPDYLEEERQEGERFLQLLLAPFDRDRQGGVLVVLHDVTQQRKNQEMQREFVANVSHELRTPLTNILSLIHISASCSIAPDSRRSESMGRLSLRLSLARESWLRQRTGTFSSLAMIFRAREMSETTC